MTGRRANRGHATRVALAATAVVMACYAVAVVGLYAVVSARLTHEVDARLATVLASADQWTLPQGPAGSVLPASHGNDVDAAPSFVWRVAPTGAVTSLTAGAPSLPRRAWSAGPTSLDLGAAPFRFDVARQGRGWLVAGQSITEVGRVRAALWVPVLVFGVLLALAAFVGSLVVGLRASAPLEEVRRRQAEFTADASHELRTPLSVIEAEVELALSGPQDADEYVGVLRRVAGEGRRLRRIVDDLLWLARVDREPSAAPSGG
ncbi:MAG: histidine kinase dimerization/phospho-acceptor domain-containing protein, partial [Acidimicrobiales bacterium]